MRARLVLLVLALAALALPAHAVSYTPTSSAITCVKDSLKWNPDGATQTFNIRCTDINGAPYLVPFQLDGTNVKDRYGATVFSEPAGVASAISTLATAADSAVTSLAGQAGKLDKP